MRFTKLTPNLVVKDVQRSLDFYTEKLGFELGMTVPKQPPFVWASVKAGGVEIFFNLREAAAADNPQWATQLLGGTLTQYIEVEGIEELLARVRGEGIEPTQPFEEKSYGMREFAIADPDGWILTFAEPVQR